MGLLRTKSDSFVGCAAMASSAETENGLDGQMAMVQPGIRRRKTRARAQQYMMAELFLRMLRRVHRMCVCVLEDAKNQPTQIENALSLRAAADLYESISAFCRRARECERDIAGVRGSFVSKRAFLGYNVFLRATFISSHEPWYIYYTCMHTFCIYVWFI